MNSARPKPIFQNPIEATEKAVEDSPLTADAVVMQPHAAASTAGQSPVEDYVLSVEEIRFRLSQSGISKSKDTVQRYCREGMLDCLKLGMLRRYFATEASVEDLIENLKQDADASGGMHLHEGAFNDDPNSLQVRPTEIEPVEPDRSELHAAASTRTQDDASAFSSELDAFFREQIRVKDDQLRVKDEQVAAMLERDHETNILVREFQGLVAKTFSLLPASKDFADDLPQGDVTRTTSASRQTDVENGQAGGVTGSV